MKKNLLLRRSWLMLLVLFISAGMSLQAIDDYQIIDPSFEEAPVDGAPLGTWSNDVGAPLGGSYTSRVQNIYASTGNNSFYMRFRADGNSYNKVSTLLEGLTPGRSYTFSFNYKGQDGIAGDASLVDVYAAEVANDVSTNAIGDIYTSVESLGGDETQPMQSGTIKFVAADDACYIVFARHTGVKTDVGVAQFNFFIDDMHMMYTPIEIIDPSFEDAPVNGTPLGVWSNDVGAPIGGSYTSRVQDIYASTGNNSFYLRFRADGNSYNRVSTLIEGLVPGESYTFSFNYKGQEGVAGDASLVDVYAAEVANDVSASANGDIYTSVESLDGDETQLVQTGSIEFVAADDACYIVFARHSGVKTDVGVAQFNFFIDDIDLIVTPAEYVDLPISISLTDYEPEQTFLVKGVVNQDITLTAPGGISLDIQTVTTSEAVDGVTVTATYDGSVDIVDGMIIAFSTIDIADTMVVNAKVIMANGVVDGGFEEAPVNGAPLGTWSNDLDAPIGGSYTSRVQDIFVPTGNNSFGLRFLADGNSYNKVSTLIEGLDASKTYIFNFNYKIDRSSAEAIVDVYAAGIANDTSTNALGNICTTVEVAADADGEDQVVQSGSFSFETLADGSCYIVFARHFGFFPNVAEFNFFIDDLSIMETSNDATLSTLTTDVGTLDPTFDPTVISYAITVPYGTTVVNLAATSNDANATFTGDGAIDVSSGSATATIVVTAEDGTTQKSYTVNINVEANSDASLSALTTDVGTLDPTFDPTVTSYVLEVPQGTTVANLSATSNDANASLAGDGAIDVSSGSATATIVVTAEDETTQETYTIDISVLTGMEESMASGMRVYPTISNGNFYVEFTKQAGIVNILDVTGRKIQSFQVNSKLETVTVDEPGLYFILLEQEHRQEVVKVLRVK